MSSKNEKTKGIMKPLAAAFFATSPEEDDSFLTAKPLPKRNAGRSMMKDTEPMLGEMSTAEARALLRERLVGKPVAEDEKKMAVLETVAPVKKEDEAKQGVKEKEVPDKNAGSAVSADKKADIKAAEKKAPAKESPAKNASENKASENKAVKKPAKKPDQGQAVSEKAPVRDAAAESVYVEYAGQSYDIEELKAKAIQVWTSVYKRSRRELWSVELYVKPQEKKAYYVLNKRKNGSIDL
ncbi:MAG: hypothetical protein IJ600_04335 [Lachnospiraceae bacterium]|nr:hypothetical protein [Lachnospiraceae bacterium]